MRIGFIGIVLTVCVCLLVVSLIGLAPPCFRTGGVADEVFLSYLTGTLHFLHRCRRVEVEEWIKSAVGPRGADGRLNGEENAVGQHERRFADLLGGEDV